MPKVLLLTCLILTSITSFSQSEKPVFVDSLSAIRNFMQTDVYRNGIKLKKDKFSSLLLGNSKWYKKNKIANIILPAGPIISAGGVYLAYDAIKGVPMVYTEDGVDYPYVVRSLPKLLGGLALFVTGLCLVESANETKANATNWYNQDLMKNLKKKETSFKLNLGISKSGGVGLTANF
ncbi:hypothetical protein [Arcticibacterium luteifluviistationis]|uniref:DUF5683 domain-containing protein n=1 Tax=Arcticibacterium luteifluviistationis TaxID=1784714 RepID=A0A2Z4G9G6_9BACT|nr:hypothetical protein [Arcticibacterium luteifluviistationis]AWV97826.1 hypothetical protein DJ013_06445 [Arcticibacterium luteifluviistationis]